MNEISRYFRILLLTLLTPGLLTSAVFGQGIMNGGFEAPPPPAAPDFPPWAPVGGPMVRAPGSAGTPPNSALLGPVPGIPVPVPGARGRVAMISQTFNCGNGSVCWIRFDYRLLRIPLGASAFVLVRGGQVVRWAQLAMAPQGAGAGFMSTQIQYPACGNLEVVFSIFDPGRQVTPIFRVDEVKSACDTMFQGIPELSMQELASAQGCPEDPQCAVFAAIADAISSAPPTTQPVNRAPRVFVALVILLVILAAAGSFILLRRRRRRAE